MEELINSGFRAYGVILLVVAVIAFVAAGRLLLRYCRATTPRNPPLPASDSSEPVLPPELCQALASISWRLNKS